MTEYPHYPEHTPNHDHHDVIVTGGGNGLGLVVGILLAALFALALWWAISLDDGDSPGTQVDVTIEQQNPGG